MSRAEQAAESAHSRFFRWGRRLVLRAMSEGEGPTSARAGDEHGVSWERLERTDPGHDRKRDLERYVFHLWTEQNAASDALRRHLIWPAWKCMAGVELSAQEFWAIRSKRSVLVALGRHLRRTGKPIDTWELDELDARTFRSAAESGSAPVCALVATGRGIVEMIGGQGSRSTRYQWADDSVGPDAGDEGTTLSTKGS